MQLYSFIFIALLTGSRVQWLEAARAPPVQRFLATTQLDAARAPLTTVQSIHPILHTHTDHGTHTAALALKSEQRLQPQLQ